MNVFAINLKVVTHNGQNFWLLFECEHTFDSLLAAMREDAPIRGNKLVFSRQADGGRLIKARTPLVVAGASIATVSPCTIEQEDRRDGEFTVEIVRVAGEGGKRDADHAAA